MLPNMLYVSVQFCFISYTERASNNVEQVEFSMKPVWGDRIILILFDGSEYQVFN